jgi:thiamine monophosphate synthase
MQRSTKIVATLGPSSSDATTLERMFLAGVDVVRLNFSHGTAEDHEKRAELVRECCRKVDRAVGIMCDLQGPKIRVGDIEARSLNAAQDRSPPAPAARGRRSLTAASARREEGRHHLLDDRLISFASCAPPQPTSSPRDRAALTSHRINIPGRKLSTPALTPKDRRDLAAGVKMGVDYVALSFVREAADVEALKRAMRRLKADIPIIAKIEKPQAVENLDAIIEHADGIMVARGDLGVELPGGCPDPAEAHDPCRAARGKAGHHRHPDARVDDSASAPHSRRGLGRGQRDLRRDRRGDALRGDRDRRLPGRSGADDGAHHRARGGARRTGCFHRGGRGRIAVGAGGGRGSGEQRSAQARPPSRCSPRAGAPRAWWPSSARSLQSTRSRPRRASGSA